MAKSAAAYNLPKVRDIRIYELHVLEGKTCDEIAAQVGISKTAVAIIINKMTEYYVGVYINNVDAIRAKQTRQLINIYAESMEAWQNSKNDTVTIEVASEFGDAGLKDGPINLNKNKTVRKSSAGNPAFLDQARQALGDIRKIWGAEAPIKIDEKKTLTIDVNVRTNLRNLTVDEVMELNRLRSKMLGISNEQIAELLPATD